MNEISKKETLLLLTKNLTSRHEDIKKQMIQILESTKLLDDQYRELEDELYSIEKKYADTIKEMI